MGDAPRDVEVAPVLTVVVPAGRGPRSGHDGSGPGVFGREGLAACHARRRLALAQLVFADQFHPARLVHRSAFESYTRRCGGAQKTSTRSSSWMEWKRCSVCAATYTTVPGPTDLSSPATRIIPRPDTTW